MSDTILCPPPSLDWDLLTLAKDAANNADDIGLSSSELLLINGTIGDILAAHPDVYETGDGSASNPKTPGQPVAPVSTERIRFDQGLLDRLHNAIHGARGRLWRKLTELEKARMEMMIQSLQNAHPKPSPQP